MSVERERYGGFHRPTRMMHNKQRSQINLPKKSFSPFRDLSEEARLRHESLGKKKLTNKYETIDLWKKKYGNSGLKGAGDSAMLVGKVGRTIELPSLGYKPKTLPESNSTKHATINFPQEQFASNDLNTMSATFFKRKLTRKDMIQQAIHSHRKEIRVQMDDKPVQREKPVQIQRPVEKHFDKVLKKVTQEPLARWASDSEQEDENLKRRK